MAKEKLVLVDMYIRNDAMQLIKAKAKRDGVSQREVMWKLLEFGGLLSHEALVTEIRAAGFWDDPDDPNGFGIIMTYLALKHLKVN